MNYDKPNYSKTTKQANVIIDTNSGITHCCDFVSAHRIKLPRGVEYRQ